ncbi:MAG: hypothetical protein IPL58_10860 [Betaproteobacteria bacterium]|uniref:Uncharacterized protein n=1 Tax=Candidatus Proximibacter danicus TaxID=2954365 RepID=A0A9D7K4K5_9PROT|nr:hypothetical protein [Candidatus Proximibacter danicus]
MTAGIWAFGFFILTILLKDAIGILQGEISYGSSQATSKQELRQDHEQKLIPNVDPRALLQRSRLRCSPKKQGSGKPKKRTASKTVKGAREITKREIKPGLPNIKCSATTDAVL